MSKLVDEKGNELSSEKLVEKLKDEGVDLGKDIAKQTPQVEIESIKASQRTRSHLNSPGNIQRSFDSEESMVENASKLYNNNNIKEHEADKEKGFDFESIESVKNFKTGYTPVGNTVLVKIIQEDNKIGQIFIPVGSGDSIKAVVVVPGLYVNNLKAGDVISIKKVITTPNGKPQPVLPPMEDHFIKGIKFKELPFAAISGAYIEREELIKRISEENAKLGYKND